MCLNQIDDMAVSLAWHEDSRWFGSCCTRHVRLAADNNAGACADVDSGDNP